MSKKLPKGHREDPFTMPTFNCPICGVEMQVKSKFALFESAPCISCKKPVRAPDYVMDEIRENIEFEKFLKERKRKRAPIKPKNKRGNPKATAIGQDDYRQFLGSENGAEV